MTIGAYLVVGLCAGGRVCVGIAWQNEFLETKYQALMTSLVGCADSIPMFG